MFKILLISILIFSTIVSACNNSTGTCKKNYFICANEEAISHSKRCDGIEDCADGTDEYLCEKNNFNSRNSIIEVACIKCTCLKGSLTILPANTWWSIAKLAPRDLPMLTYVPGKQNKGCNPSDVTSITLNVYKKQNKGCRGWVCCLRQSSCNSCTSNLATNNCWP